MKPNEARFLEMTRWLEILVLSNNLGCIKIHADRLKRGSSCCLWMPGWCMLRASSSVWLLRLLPRLPFSFPKLHFLSSAVSCDVLGVVLTHTIFVVCWKQSLSSFSKIIFSNKIHWSESLQIKSKWATFWRVQVRQKSTFSKMKKNYANTYKRKWCSVGCCPI